MSLLNDPTAFYKDGKELANINPNMMIQKEKEKSAGYDFVRINKLFH